MTAYVSVSIGGDDFGRVREIEAEIRAFPQILECYSVSGDDDYLLKVVAHDLKIAQHLPHRPADAGPRHRRRALDDLPGGDQAAVAVAGRLTLSRERRWKRSRTRSRRTSAMITLPSTQRARTSDRRLPGGRLRHFLGKRRLGNLRPAAAGTMDRRPSAHRGRRRSATAPPPSKATKPLCVDEGGKQSSSTGRLFFQGVRTDAMKGSTITSGIAVIRAAAEAILRTSRGRRPARQDRVASTEHGSASDVVPTAEDRLTARAGAEMVVHDAAHLNRSARRTVRGTGRAPRARSGCARRPPRRSRCAG